MKDKVLEGDREAKEKRETTAVQVEDQQAILDLDREEQAQSPTRERNLALRLPYEG